MSVSRIWGYLRDYRFWAIVGALAFLVAVMLWNPSHNEPRKAAFDDPAAAAAVPTATSATSSPPPKKPVLPAAAHNPTEEAAAAFARYAMEVFDYSFAASDTSVVSTLCLPVAEWCSDIVQQVKAEKTSQYTYENGRVTVDSVKTIRRNPVQVTALISVSVAELHTLQAGKTVGSEPSAKRTTRMLLWWSGKAKTWRIRAATDEANL